MQTETAQGDAIALDDLFTIEELPYTADKSATLVRVIMDAGFTVWAPGQVSVLKNVTV